MKEILIATNNKGKAKDFETLFKPYGFVVKTLNDLETPIDVEETGVTFEENAILKAEEVATLLNTIVIADDSGLEIDVLNGEPGVYSARYAGLEKSDEANIEKVLQKLEGSDNRNARFRCVLAVAGPNFETTTFSGSCEGTIVTAKRGTNGFGYDPIFQYENDYRTLAELTAEEKSAISHRGNALRQLQIELPYLLEKLGSAR